MKIKLKKLFVLVVIAFFAISCSQEKPITIYTIGDSTMANKGPEVYPENGWCQVLQQFFNENVIVENRALNGRSTKSFNNEGHWQSVLDSLKTGDYVFIQFGHNDQKKNNPKKYAAPYGLYKSNLEKFVNETRLKKANPILFTSIARRRFDKSGKLIDTHGKYIEVVKEVSKSMNVPMIDLNKLTSDLVNRVGVEASKEIYLWAPPNKKYPEGRKDNTHLDKQGAQLFAALAVQEILKLNNSLINYISWQEKIPVEVCAHYDGADATIIQATDKYYPGNRKRFQNDSRKYCSAWAEFLAFKYNIPLHAFEYEIGGGSFAQFLKTGRGGCSIYYPSGLTCNFMSVFFSIERPFHRFT